ncbi:MAG: hypothetical protein QW506_04655 [Thermoproteota archaeon]
MKRGGRGMTANASSEFRVLKTFLASEVGFIEAEVEGVRRRLEVRRKGRTVLVDGVPLSNLRLLFLNHEDRRD